MGDVAALAAGGKGIADAHIHLFEPADVDAYEALRVAHGIERALVVGYEGDTAHAGNNEAIRAWAQHRSWIAPLAYSDPPGFSPDVLEWAAGVSLYVFDQASAGAACAWADSLVSALADRRAVVSVNTTVGVVGLLRPLFARLVGASVLVSHLCLPPRRAAPPSRAEARAALGPLLSFAPLPHVGVKVSGLYAMTEPASQPGHAAARPYVEAVAESFGVDRLYWGSDFPPALPHAPFEAALTEVEAIGWSADEWRAVRGGNLSRLLAAVDPPRQGR